MVPARPALLVFALGASVVFGGCSGCLFGEDAKSRQVLGGGLAGAASNPTERELIASGLLSGTCSPDASIVCDDSCCPLGTECDFDGGCESAIPADECPPDAPVRCDRASWCDGGVCLAPDLSSNGNDAVLSAGAWLGAGVNGAGADTHESSSCAGPLGPRIIAPANGFPTGPVTIEAWVRTTWSGPQALFGYGGGAANSGVTRELYVEADGGWQWPGPCSGTKPGGLAIADGDWHFIAASYESNWTGAVFLDGVRLGTCNVSRPLLSGERFFIGNRPNQFCGFHGQIDEVRVLDLALPEAVISDDFNGGPLAAGPGVVGLWKFDQDNASCCPAGTSCTPEGTCAAATSTTEANCTGTATKSCNDGRCCPQTMTCTAGGCSPSEPIAQPGGGCPAGTIGCGTSAGWCCPSGFGCGPSDNCLAQPLGTAPIVPDGGAPDGGGCGAAPVCGAKCCNAGETCLGGLCCPAGSIRCGTGTCCPAGSGCNAYGECSAPSSPPSCGPGTIVCGTACCPAGTPCNSGFCGQPAQPAVCAGARVNCNGTCCGAMPSCTGTGTSCYCGFKTGCAQRRNACGCKSGFCKSYRVRNGSASWVCSISAPSKVAPASGSPLGPKCGTGYCAAGQVCSGSTCCAADHPVGCGATCCLPGASCVGGRCSCPPGSPECGPQCCGAGATCFNGACRPGCPTPGLSVPCGQSYCCAAGVACGAQGCSCPSSHPVPCGIQCCLPGAVCSAGSECGCPGGAAPCGNACCSATQECTANVCVQKDLFGGVGGGGGSGGGGGGGGGGSSCPSTCSTHADCAAFGSRNCSPKQGYCGADGQCHCCYALCSGGGSDCQCLGCTSCTGDRMCVSSTCVFKVGGGPCD